MSKQGFRGLVVARQGKLAHVWVSEVQQRFRCHARRQQLQVVCGDWVDISTIGENEGVVEQCESRRNVFSRSDELRTKTIAANVDQIIGVLAWDPLPSESLLMRWMIVAYDQGVDFILVVNKQDLAPYVPEHPLREWVPRYRELGATIVEVSAKDGDISPLRAYLQGKTSLFIGQSGSGKSSIINELIPGLNLHTQILSDAMGGGRHTTTTTQLYWLDEARESAVLDSPGMQTFGVRTLSREAIMRACPDLVVYRGQCRFRDCKHLQEPDCAFHAALDRGDIHQDRWAIVQELWDESTGE